VRFSLGIIHASLEDFISSFVPKPLTASERLERAVDHFAREEFSRKHYLELFRTISTATASRDLKDGVDQGQLSKFGEKALTRYEFIRMESQICSKG
jgi:predicted HTH transcriptional regulator